MISTSLRILRRERLARLERESWLAETRKGLATMPEHTGNTLVRWLAHLIAPPRATP